MATVFKEVWTGSIFRQLISNLETSFLEGVVNGDQYVDNDVIHLTALGADPTVLIDNTDYPLDVEALNDSDVAITLNKYETKATPITDDELYALSYDKIKTVKERHGNVLSRTRLKRALHTIAPSSNATGTPVFATTGAGNADGYRKITRKDIIKMKRKFDQMHVPLAGRRLVLCPQHVQDLLEDDQNFAEQYHNYKTGKIYDMYGFEIFEFIECPYYTSQNARLLWTATPGATDRQASIAFYKGNIFKCEGSLNMYYSAAAQDPLYHRNLVNFLNRFYAGRVRNEAVGAIVSADAPAEEVVIDPGYITASPTALSFAAAGEDKTVDVTNSSEWYFECEDTGFSAAKNADGTGLVVTAAANTGAARSGSAKVFLAADDTVEAVINLTQESGQ